MLKQYKVAIIGGGSSGLLCAAELLRGKDALPFGDVLVLEKNDRVGKKLVATGNGQGNFCNADLSLSHYYGDRGFISAFFKDNNIDVAEYFYNLGIPLYPDECGRFYPLSKQASSALDVIRSFLLSRKCVIETGITVSDVDKSGEIFVIKTNNGDKFFAENVVFAFGGKAGAHFGTDGGSYKLAENLGHKITALSPSLVQLKTDKTSIRGLKGIKERVRLYLYDGTKYIAESVGDLLFTDYGVSGNAVFSLSPKIAQTENPIFYADLLPDIDVKDLINILEFRKNADYILDDDLFIGLVNKKLGQAVARLLDDKSIKNAAESLKKYKIKVNGTLGFDCAQVTKGGIVTDDVNPFTMQSKLCKRLFITGEALNVDGDCGGYNLAFAFLSGIKAAKSIKESYNI